MNGLADGAELLREGRIDGLDDGLAGMNADADTYRWIVELGDLLLHCEARKTSAHRVVLERFRRAEQSQHAIPQSLGDDAIMLMDGGAHQRQDRSDASQRRLGILALDMRGRVFQVRKKHAYVFAFPAAGAQRVELLPERRFRRLLRKGGAATRAKPAGRSAGLAAFRAYDLKALAAFVAKAVAGLVLGAASTAFKRHRHLGAHALPGGAVNLPAAGPRDYPQAYVVDVLPSLALPATSFIALAA